LVLAAIRRRVASLLVVLVVAAALPFAVGVPVARAVEPELIDGFRDEAIWTGLSHPSAIAFTPSGTAFVAEKNGRIFSFDSVTDTTPTLVANLVTNVHNAWDRGMLGLAVDPDYPTRPYIYVLYTYDHVLGDGAAPPRWGTAGEENDTCPNPPGFTGDGCVVSGRLSRLTISGGVQSGGEQVLIEDWCQQFPSHSVGHVMIGPEGALYASAGEGASFALSADYGQLGGTRPEGGPFITPRNPCGDPPGGVGGDMTIPTAEGGSLRSQDIRTRGAGDPVGLSGTVIRINPDTGAAWPTNANAGDSSANARRIIAYGLRNPFRFTIDPDGRVWIGDVGSSEWEEINVIDDPSAAPRNFGWPCREGANSNPTFDVAELDLCTSLAAASTTSPQLKWSHRAETVPGDGCGGESGFSSASIAGLAFLPDDSPFPAPYDGALFANDYSRRCIWAFPLGQNGRPDPAQMHRFADLRRTGDTSGGAVQLMVSPAGDLLYVDYDRGEIRRIKWYGPSQPPEASFTATPSFGSLPLDVDFDASDSSDPNPEPLTYAWDLDGDGQYDDGNGVTISRSYASAGAVQVGLKVTDSIGLSDIAARRIDPGNSPPELDSVTPGAQLMWKVGDAIPFAATASDGEDGALPASAFHWTFEMLHCPGQDCHSHVIQELSGVRSGTFIAPDHEYPSHLRLTVTVTDSGGMTASTSRELEPVTATLSASSSPAGIPLTLGTGTGAPPPPVTGIVGSLAAVSAPDTAVIGEDRYAFSSWSDGGDQAHDAVLPEGGGTITATFAKAGTVDTPDTCAAAPAGGAPTGAWISGAIGKANDVDWYRFKLSSTRRVRVVLGDLAVGARVELYRGCSTLITGVDQGGTTPEELFRTLPEGSYAVRVIGKSTPSTTPYALNIRNLANGVSVLSSRSITNGGTLRLVGEIYNNSSKQRQVTVTAKLYSAGGALLATRSAVTVISTVEPLARAPYVISGSLPAGYARAVISLSSPSTSRAVSRPAVSGTVSAADGTDHRVVSGNVRNTGSKTVSTLRVGVILYTSRLATLEVIRATTAKTTLAGGASTTYAATSVETGLTPAFVRVRTSAYLP